MFKGRIGAAGAHGTVNCGGRVISAKVEFIGVAIPQRFKWSARVFMSVFVNCDISCLCTYEKSHQGLECAPDGHHCIAHYNSQYHREKKLRTVMQHSSCRTAHSTEQSHWISTTYLRRAVTASRHNLHRCSAYLRRKYAGAHDDLHLRKFLTVANG